MNRNLRALTAVSLPLIMFLSVATGFAGASDDRIVSPEAGMELAQVTSLTEFVNSVKFRGHDTTRLTRNQYLGVIDQITLIWEHAYVHQRLKETLHDANPVFRLKQLRKYVVATTDSQLESPEFDNEFHDAMKRIVNGLKDRHARYKDLRMGNWTAVLGFTLRSCISKGKKRYYVADVAEWLNDPKFKKHVVITHWNGRDIQDFLGRFANELPAGNESAAAAQAELYSTNRPLQFLPTPSEEFVTLSYLQDDESNATARTVTLRWKALEVRDPAHRGTRGFDPDDIVNRVTDECLGLANSANRILFQPSFYDELTDVEKLVREAPTDLEDKLSRSGNSTLPDTFEYRTLSYGNKRVGYLRIKNFIVANANDAAAEFKRILQSVPSDGLLIDLRANPGGYAPLSDMLLQMLSASPIMPQRFQFANSDLNLQTVNNKIFARYMRSVSDGVRVGDQFSAGFAIEGTAHDEIERVYEGDVVLIIDGLTYSAADHFAAGFQDHRCGKVFGVGTTGGGGANVWEQRYFRLLHSQFRIPSSLIEGLNDERPSASVIEEFQSHGIALSNEATVSHKPGPFGNEWRIDDHGMHYLVRQMDWLTQDLNVFHNAQSSAIQDLPPFVGFEFSLRRSVRSGLSHGVPLEDLGVTADVQYEYTCRDITNDECDLLKAGMTLLIND